MKFFRRCAFIVTFVSLALGSATSVLAQISSINSDSVTARDPAVNAVPGSTLTTANNYPTSVSFDDQGVSTASGFANRHFWQFSNNGGTSAYLFQNTDYFHVSYDLTLTGNPITPRKEAGFKFNLASMPGNPAQFIIDTDAHEIVQFGGLGFHSFGNTYNSGNKITLGITYFLDSNGRNALIFTANGVDSPPQEFAAGVGIGNGSTLENYFQINNDSANPSNGGSALFQNISITPVPEPSALALLGLGLLPVLFRRSR